MKQTNEKHEKNNITELVFILDRSGSMGGLESDTIGGFNSMIEKQKRESGTAYVTTILFDHEIERLHDRLPLEEVRPMTGEDYTVRGCTALLDALGDTILHIADIHKYARKEDVPDNTVFVITTDGMENASRRYGSREIKKLIEKQKKRCGWEFLFIGANIDAVETARSYGIDEDRAVNYNADSQGTRIVYEAVCNAVGSVRKSAPLAPSWSKSIDEDYKKRKK